MRTTEADSSGHDCACISMEETILPLLGVIRGNLSPIRRRVARSHYEQIDELSVWRVKTKHIEQNSLQPRVVNEIYDSANEPLMDRGVAVMLYLSKYYDYCDAEET